MADEFKAVDGTDDLKRVWIFGEFDTPFEFDAVLREAPTTELAICDNPVETGVSMTDHTFMQPARLEIEAAVGDVTLKNGRTSTYENKSLRVVDGPPRVDVFGDGGTRSVTAYEKLLALQSSGEPFSVQTGLKLWKNMLIGVLSTEQDKDTDSILYFRASLREVQFASTQTVTYPPRADDKTKRQASAPKSGGEKKTADPGKKADSILYGAMPDDLKQSFQKDGIGGALDTLKGKLGL